MGGDGVIRDFPPLMPLPLTPQFPFCSPSLTPHSFTPILAPCPPLLTTLSLSPTPYLSLSPLTPTLYFSVLFTPLTFFSFSSTPHHSILLPIPSPSIPLPPSPTSPLHTPAPPPTCQSYSHPPPYFFILPLFFPNKHLYILLPHSSLSSLHPSLPTPHLSTLSPPLISSSFSPHPSPFPSSPSPPPPFSPLTIAYLPLLFFLHLSIIYPSCLASLSCSVSLTLINPYPPLLIFLS